MDDKTCIPIMLLKKELDEAMGRLKLRIQMQQYFHEHFELAKKHTEEAEEEVRQIESAIEKLRNIKGENNGCQNPKTI